MLFTEQDQWLQGFVQILGHIKRSMESDGTRCTEVYQFFVTFNINTSVRSQNAKHKSIGSVLLQDEQRVSLPLGCMKVNIEDFLQVFQGSGIGKMEDDLTSADPLSYTTNGSRGDL